MRTGVKSDERIRNRLFESLIKMVEEGERKGVILVAIFQRSVFLSQSLSLSHSLSHTQTLPDFHNINSVESNGVSTSPSFTIQTILFRYLLQNDH